MALLDAWKSPEPSPYFLSGWTRGCARSARLRRRLAGKLDCAAAARFAYGPSMHVRPLAAMALAVMLLVGGGTYMGITNLDKPAAPPGQAAVVNDLQKLDNNAQVLDQMEALSSTNNNGE